MSSTELFRVTTVGWGPKLIEYVGNRISEKGEVHFCHVVHPRHTSADWPSSLFVNGDVEFIRNRLDQPLPQVDRLLLASLEAEGVPTVHNMIMGDRVVSKLPYSEALRYATMLANRLNALFETTLPSVVIVGFDSIHGSIGMAVARKMGIPVFALHFSVLPPGLACFCDRMSPASRVIVAGQDEQKLRRFAESSLEEFEKKRVSAHAYIAPSSMSLLRVLASMPRTLRRAIATIRIGRAREYLKFTESQNSYNVLSAVKYKVNSTRARNALSSVRTVDAVPDFPFVLFGFHMQPESSIDVWAPFFSNQKWVVELLARSIPPSHRLLVKIHKSDISNYSANELQAMKSLPGVEFVLPFADTRSFIESADLVVAIQGTMGLEAALLGKPVIMLGDSPVTIFPSAFPVKSLRSLPALVARALNSGKPMRDEIVSAYAEFLAPFFPARLNIWNRSLTDSEAAGFIKMFSALKSFLTTQRE